MPGHHLAQRAQDEYVERVLEELAFAAHANGGLTVEAFENHCHRHGVGHLLGGTVHVTADLLPLPWAAVARRLFPMTSDGERRVAPMPALVEHHLLARRLLRLVRRTHDEMSAYGPSRWTDRDALEHWYSIASQIRLTPGVREAVISRLGVEDTLDPRVAHYELLQWQRTLGRLFAAVLCDAELRTRVRSHAAPGNGLSPDAAETTLLFILNSCGRETGTVHETEWRSPTALRDWLDSLDAAGHTDLRRIALAQVNRVSLRGQDLSQRDLREANLAGGSLHGASLRGVCLRGADLADTDAVACDLSEADLRGTCWHGANLSKAVLAGATLRHARLRDACLLDADLREADLRDADFSSSCLKGASLRGANVAGALFHDVNLAATDLPAALRLPRPR